MPLIIVESILLHDAHEKSRLPAAIAVLSLDNIWIVVNESNVDWLTDQFVDWSVSVSEVTTVTREKTRDVINALIDQDSENESVVVVFVRQIGANAFEVDTGNPSLPTTNFGRIIHAIKRVNHQNAPSKVDFSSSIATPAKLPTTPTHAIFNKIRNTSNFLQHLRMKYLLCRTLLFAQTPALTCYDTLSTLTIDSLLGLLFMLFFLSTSLPTQICQYVPSIVHSCSNQLQTLVETIMGVPLGLKLNQPLAHFLGRLFFYHLYIWKSWISVMQPLLPSLLFSCSFSALFGLSTFISMLLDLIDLSTIHLHCFYHYAVRLYSFTLSQLTALFRIFRGKKINPLRSRIDHHSYDTEQFILGSLLFTIFIFLFPTIAVFYFVFTAIRLTLILLKYALLQIANLMIHQPFFSLSLKLFFPARIVSEYYLQPFVFPILSVPCYKFCCQEPTIYRLYRHFLTSLPFVDYFYRTPTRLVTCLFSVIMGEVVSFNSLWKLNHID